MSDDPGNPSSFLGNPGEPVAEVDPDDLKTFWQKSRELQARHPDVSVGFEMKAICRAGANPAAVWYRSGMIWVLSQYAQEQLAPLGQGGTGFRCGLPNHGDDSDGMDRTY